MIASLALPALFIVSGLFALGVLAMSWQTYAHQMFAIRDELGKIDADRVFTVRITAPIRVTAEDVRERGPAVVRRPVRRIQPAASGPAIRAQPALRAAA
ncbi:MAG: hypothetical protein FP826_08915 [Sphingomonadales bacterium]|nr:hypothetical protein [Sphingomonadales bacterium]MBU3992341.1 hypothetical protein [Alphaproteobacteria bacterium]